MAARMHQTLCRISCFTSTRLFPHLMVRRWITTQKKEPSFQKRKNPSLQKRKDSSFQNVRWVARLDPSDVCWFQAGTDWTGVFSLDFCKWQERVRGQESLLCVVVYSRKSVREVCQRVPRQ